MSEPINDIWKDPNVMAALKDAERARDMSIVMGYEAMRICIGEPTRIHDPTEVFRWMKLMIELGPQRNKS